MLDDGLVIDVSGMRGIFVEPAARTVIAQTGLTWGEFDRETHVHGMATTGGLIAGLTLGGGVGWLMGRCGLVCDNTLNYDVVLASGEIARANASENADLFWALKGGGGNFGVVTSITYRLYPIQEVLSPLTRAKAEVERTLAASDLDYTILGANFFMEVWLSPALGFDVAHRKALIFGDGNSPISWVSYHDVAEFAIRSHRTPAARNQHFDIGGPQDLSPLDVVAVFEKDTGEPFEKQFVRESALLAQLERANDPLAETFLKLQLEYAHGCIMDSSETLRAMPLNLRTVDEFATEVLEQSVPA